jgi:hypothetical protein
MRIVRVVGSRLAVGCVIFGIAIFEAVEEREINDAVLPSLIGCGTGVFPSAREQRRRQQDASQETTARRRVAKRRNSVGRK